MRIAGAVVAAVALVLCGCSDDDTPEGAETTEAVEPVNLCSELTPAALRGVTGIDFGAGEFDGIHCVWTAADGSKVGMSVQRDDLLAGWFVVVQNQGGQVVPVDGVVRAVGSSNPDGTNQRVLVGVETHPGIGVTVTLITPTASIDQAVSLARQVFSAAGY